MSEAKISEAAVEAARHAYTEADERNESGWLCARAAIAAALPHLHPQPAELAEQQWDVSLNTSEGGRRYVADFFARELRRHDFTRYITTTLAADFACALAQHLAARQQGAQEPIGYLDPRVIDPATGKLGMRRGDGALTYSGDKPMFGWTMPIYAAPPAQGIDLGQFREAVQEAYENADSGTLTKFSLEELLALIDQRDAAPGVE